MDSSRWLSCLDRDVARLGEVAAQDLSATVPTCPAWTVADLVRHVAEVYLHRADCIRLNAEPTDWAPDLTSKPPLTLLEDAYRDLSGQFASHEPAAPAYTWFAPDQTVGFWLRRMAQETVIHRVDAEIAVAAEIADIPDDLAVDGIDEVLTRFLEYGALTWPQEFAPARATATASTVRITAGPTDWQVSTGPTGVVVTQAAEEHQIDRVDAEVTGSPSAVLLWLWTRTEDSEVRLAGDAEAIAQLRRFLTVGEG